MNNLNSISSFFYLELRLTNKILLLETGKKVIFASLVFPNKDHPTLSKFSKEADSLIQQYCSNKILVDVIDELNQTILDEGRSAYIFSGNIHVNKVLLEKGYAKLKVPLSPFYMKELVNAQNKAMELKRGIWSVINERPKSLGYYRIEALHKYGRLIRDYEFD